MNEDGEHADQEDSVADVWKRDVERPGECVVNPIAGALVEV